MKPSEPGLWFEGSFLMTQSISLLIIGIFRFSISPRVSFDSSCLSRNLSIPPSYLICWFSCYTLLKAMGPGATQLVSPEWG